MDAICSCAIYASRPKQCVDHNFDNIGAYVCPVGLNVLGIHDASNMAAREHLIEGMES